MVVNTRLPTHALWLMFGKSNTAEDNIGTTVISAVKTVTSNTLSLFSLKLCSVWLQLNSPRHHHTTALSNGWYWLVLLLRRHWPTLPHHLSPNCNWTSWKYQHSEILYWSCFSTSTWGWWIIWRPAWVCIILVFEPKSAKTTLKRDSQKLFCDATRDATGAKPGKPQIAAMSHPTQLTQLGHRMPSQKLSLAQLLRCDAMRQAIWCTILTFSTAKLYKGARVAYNFLQVVSNRANIMVTYPNQQNFVASLTSSVNGISRVRIARIHRRSRRIACESRFRGFVIFSRKRSICDIQRFFDHAANSATSSSWTPCLNLFEVS